MKIEYKVKATNSNLRFVIDFKIVGVISKEQFKTLMVYSDYNKVKRTGSAVFHKDAQVKGFTAYIDSINTDFTEYKIEYKNKKESTTLSFEDFCVDHLNLDPSLMTTEQKAEAHKAFRK